MCFVYWLLIAIYTFAALAHSVAAGDELVTAAAAVPGLACSAPAVASQIASAVTDAMTSLMQIYRIYKYLININRYI